MSDATATKEKPVETAPDAKVENAPETPAPKLEKAAPSKLSPSGYSNHAIHLVRTTMNNTLKLSQMADQKASILMGATFLVFSISVSRALVGDLPWAMIVLAFFAFLSSLCAVMAVMPAIGKPKGPVPRPNHLFFGHFAHRDEDEWMDEVLEQLKADETVFTSMLRDIHQNGSVLQHKKFKFLGLAYRLFVAGLFLTLITFGMEAWLDT